MRNKGFTLIEILVVISIIVILSGIVLINYRVSTQHFALQRSAVKLASDIRRAQEMAVASEECQPCGGGIPVGGYGISIREGDENYYVLYADADGNKHYLIPGLDPNIEEIYCEEGVKIEDVQLLQPDNDTGDITINFTPPDPETNIKGGLGLFDGDEAIITLCLIGTDCSDPKNTKTITVNKAGRIDID